jgi:hypothetical protein
MVPMALLYIGVSGQRHASAALYLREKDPRYPLDIISDISDTTVIMARAQWFCLVRSFGLVSEHWLVFLYTLSSIILKYVLIIFLRSLHLFLMHLDFGFEGFYCF